MRKTNRKQSTRSSVGAVTRFTRFKLLGRIQDLLRSPNTQITIILTESRTQELCEDIQKTLKIREDIGTTNYTIHGRFFRHVLQIRVDNGRKFKNNFVKLQRKYENVVIIQEPISNEKRIMVWLGSGVGSAIVILGLIGKLLNLWLF